MDLSLMWFKLRCDVSIWFINIGLWLCPLPELENFIRAAIGEGVDKFESQ
jgi:hypothetical protein